MAQWKREYQVREVAISCVNSTDNSMTQRRRKHGDIIVVRDPLGHIGKKEAKEFLWLLIDGLDWWDCKEIELKREDAEAEAEYKKVFSIPLHRLKQVYPALDLNRLFDRADEYQPFCMPDYESSSYPYKFIFNQKPLMAHGLIFNKLTGIYL